MGTQEPSGQARAERQESERNGHWSCFYHQAATSLVSDVAPEQLNGRSWPNWDLYPMQFPVRNAHMDRQKRKNALADVTLPALSLRSQVWRDMLGSVVTRSNPSRSTISNPLLVASSFASGTDLPINSLPQKSLTAWPPNRT